MLAATHDSYGVTLEESMTIAHKQRKNAIPSWQHGSQLSYRACLGPLSFATATFECVVSAAKVEMKLVVRGEALRAAAAGICSVWLHTPGFL